MVNLSGPEIKAAREKLRLSIGELATAAGVAYNTLRAWEDGKGKPHWATVRAVMDALDELKISFEKIEIPVDKGTAIG